MEIVIKATEFKTAREAIAYANKVRKIAITMGGKNLVVSEKDKDKLTELGSVFACLCLVEKDGEQVVVTVPVN